VSVRVPYRVSFGDTDASGRIHWGAMFRIFEQAERELWRSIGAIDMYGQVPRVHAEADYLAAMAFDDQLDVVAWFEKVGRTSAEIRFRIEREGAEIGRGGAVVVWVDENGKPRPLGERLSGVAVGSTGG
jgi:acyl-CoA thioesterase FadM